MMMIRYYKDSFQILIIPKNTLHNNNNCKEYSRTIQRSELGLEVHPGQQCVLFLLRHTCGLQSIKLDDH